MNNVSQKRCLITFHTYFNNVPCTWTLSWNISYIHSKTCIGHPQYTRPYSRKLSLELEIRLSTWKRWRRRSSVANDEEWWSRRRNVQGRMGIGSACGEEGPWAVGQGGLEGLSGAGDIQGKTWRNEGRKPSRQRDQHCEQRAQRPQALRGDKHRVFENQKGQYGGAAWLREDMAGGPVRDGWGTASSSTRRTLALTQSEVRWLCRSLNRGFWSDQHLSREPRYLLWCKSPEGALGFLGNPETVCL